MAVLDYKKSKTYSYSDLFDTQDQLDKGILGSVKVGEEDWSVKKSGGFLGIGSGSMKGTKDIDATKDTLGSILGETNAIAADKKRRFDQMNSGNQGMGKSILGGGSF